jgi:3-dehydroquinate synthase
MPVSLFIRSNIRDYIAQFEETPDFVNTLAAHQHSCFVVDENVWKIYAKNLLGILPQEQTIILPINEDRKNLDTVQELYEQLVERSAKRNLTLISFGGGILQDITGFTASTLYRGINWIYVPTTLLAQADSCIGSKTSLNYRKYKNLVGTFFPPSRIHIYPPFVQTQLDEDFFSGIGEIIKLHLMGGIDRYHELVEMLDGILERQPKLLTKIIQQSLHVKLSYMAGDEFDIGRRNLLNFGHDFGHALESTSNFSIPHGQAVIFGMLAANVVSRRRGLLTDKIEKEIAEKLLLPNLVTFPTADAMNSEVMLKAMEKDKKRTNNLLTLITMDDRFEFCSFNDLIPIEVANTMDELQKRMGNKSC